MNANPIKMAGHPAGFYDESKEADSGLHEVDLKRPESVTSRVAVRCKCGVKTWLSNGAIEAPCSGCGKLVKIPKP